MKKKKQFSHGIFVHYHFLIFTGVALRFIDAEFPKTPLDEKLIDIYAVATFFFSTGGISWYNNTKWKSGDPVCIWHGIECDVHGHVIAMELPRNNLIGTLPPELGLLAPRPILPLSSNNNATTAGLTRLDLSGNRIQGKIPEQVSLLSSMQEFLLPGNLLSGRIPEGIHNWIDLQRLSIVDTYLNGEIPDELCSLANVTAMMAVDCLKVECQCCNPSCRDDLDNTMGQRKPEDYSTSSTEPTASVTPGSVSPSDTGDGVAANLQDRNRSEGGDGAQIGDADSDDVPGDDDSDED